MSFQWNPAGPGGHDGGRGQQVSHWTNQEQYNTDSITSSHFMYQDSNTSTNNWNTGAPYNQWCPPASQEQLNWPCPSYPTNPYNQVLPGNFVSNTYSNYAHQSKVNCGENFTGLYDDTKRNNSFNYQLTNSFIPAQSNNYSMMKNTLMGNCQEPVKACGSQSASNTFQYWNPNSNGNQSMHYMAQPIYGNQMCDNRPSVDLKMKTSEIESNHSQTEMIQSFDKRNEMARHRQTSSHTVNSTFSNPPASKYFMGQMPHQNVSSTMSPVQKDIKCQNLLNTMCPVNSQAISSTFTPKYNNTACTQLTSSKLNDATDSSLVAAKFNNTLTSAKFNDSLDSAVTPTKFNNAVNSSNFSNNVNASMMLTKFKTANSSFVGVKFDDGVNSSLIPRNYPDSINSTLDHVDYDTSATRPNITGGFLNSSSHESEMIALSQSTSPNKDNLQRKVLDLENRIQAKSCEFEKAKKLVEGASYERSNAVIYHFNRGIKILELEFEKIETEVKEKTMDLNVPMYIGLDERGFTSQDKNGLSDQLNITLKSIKQNLGRLKDQISSHLNVAMKSDASLESGKSKSKKIEDQPNLAVAPKTNSFKQARRAVLKYLLKLSGRIENCFSELRHVKRILKDDPNDKNVIRILNKVGLHINQSRISLKEKKKLCAKCNIRLRSLTIKSSGTNILQTLESDMYHLRKFYSALSHIARHLGTIDKSSTGQDDSGETDMVDSSSYDPSNSFQKDGSTIGEDNETNNLSQEQSNGHTDSGSSQPMNQVIKRSASAQKSKSYSNYSPNKSARFMILERRFWDKLMDLSYNIRAKILALRQAERAYKNGVEGSSAKLLSLCEKPCKSLKKEFKSLAFWKKKYNLSRHLPTYILQSYPEQERRSRDKITLKSVRKNLATFMSLSYSTIVSIGHEMPRPDDSEGTNSLMKEEAKFWRRLILLNQKIQMCNSELMSHQQAMTSDAHDSKIFYPLINIEAKVKDIENEMHKEMINKQKNGFSDIMPINSETQKFKFSDGDCKDINLLKEHFQNLRGILSQIKSTQSIPLTNPELSSAIAADAQKQKSLQTHSQELPSDLAIFLSEGSSGWI